jgi:hypothetical protein
MVNEVIVAFLGTLPLAQHPESRPFTPFAPVLRAFEQDNASAATVHSGFAMIH